MSNNFRIKKCIHIDNIFEFSKIIISSYQFQAFLPINFLSSIYVYYDKIPQGLVYQLSSIILDQFPLVLPFRSIFSIFDLYFQFYEKLCVFYFQVVYQQPFPKTPVFFSYLTIQTFPKKQYFFCSSYLSHHFPSYFSLQFAI